MLGRLSLADFRGYAGLEFGLGSALTVLTGDNAQGKTNFLRAVEFLGLGEAREAAGAQIRFGAERAVVEGEVEEHGARFRMAAMLALRGGARLALNGKRVAREKWVGLLPVLFLGPEDRDQVTGPPSARRALLDELLEQCDVPYLKAVREYRRALRQRNRALEGKPADPAEAEIWEEPLAVNGGLIISHRVRVLEELAPRATAWYGELSGERGGLGISYRGTVVVPAGASSEACADALARAYAAGREHDLALGSTATGPHRDEVEISLDGRPIKGTGSSGEIWTAVLSLALSSAEHLSVSLGKLPLLLFDDVLTWLDEERCARLVAVLRGMPQAILSATRVPRAAESAAIFEVRSHSVASAGSARPGRGKGEEWDRVRSVRC